MSEAFQPTFEYFGATVKPGVPAGTMIAEISRCRPARSPVTAVTVTSAVMSVPELVMNAFEPLITHSLAVEAGGGAGGAGVGAAAGLGEAERAERLARRQRRAATRRFCSSVPNR